MLRRHLCNETRAELKRQAADLTQLRLGDGRTGRNPQRVLVLPGNFNFGMPLRMTSPSTTTRAKIDGHVLVKQGDKKERLFSVESRWPQSKR
jgi:hypothetical protein